MKKRLNTEAIRSELEGSVFFPQPQKEFFPQPQKEPQKREEHGAPKEQPTTPPLVEQNKTKVESSDTMVSRYHETSHDTTIPRNQDTVVPLNEDDMIEAVRRAVRQIGKEPATQRLTLEEKQALDDIEYSYKRQGLRTSGNEIIRIATNYIVRDYQQNGENSILAKVLNRLNS
jgi:hypothetical protein